MKIEDILPHLNDGLGTAKESESGFTDTKKIRAIWIALCEVVQFYKPQEYFRETTISFSEKIGNFPENSMIWVKLFPVGLPNNPIFRVNRDEFDKGRTNVWTEKMMDGVRKIEISDSLASATLRDIAEIQEFTSSQDEIFLPFFYCRALGLRAAGVLLRSDQRYNDAARLAVTEADSILKNALAEDTNQEQAPRYARIGSVFEEVDLFSS